MVYILLYFMKTTKVRLWGKFYKVSKNHVHIHYHYITQIIPWLISLESGLTVKILTFPAVVCRARSWGRRRLLKPGSYHRGWGSDVNQTPAPKRSRLTSRGGRIQTLKVPVPVLSSSMSAETPSELAGRFQKNTSTSYLPLPPKEKLYSALSPTAGFVGLHHPYLSS